MSFVIRRGNWVFGIALGVLVCIWAGLVWADRASRGTQEDDVLLTTQEEEIDRLLLTYADNRVVELTRASQTQRWSVVAPDDPRAEGGLLRANKQFVEALLGAVEEIRVHAVVQEGKALDDEAILDIFPESERVTVRLVTRSGDTYEFIVGPRVAGSSTGRLSLLYESGLHESGQARLVEAIFDRDVVMRDRWESSTYDQHAPSEERGDISQDGSQEPAQESVQEPAQESVQEPAQESVQEPAQESVQESAQEVMPQESIPQEEAAPAWLDE